ncbi:hypothetical protein NQ315_004941 [Exocentrus adspersus]|uniref:M-phase phosphoprotein 6 n=1 Tax=Exocentrus adspersus TaxID=1586481 RepID=A0AAV8W2J7_9CUCU|nr:hypothetical protein NQ315_004941 [Exocentrus adspersus]
MENKKQAVLSKGILEMKFMKKTKEKVQKEMEDAEGQAMYSSEITNEMRRNGNLVFIETSITSCKNLIDGRLSFGGMNPEIEKMMANDYFRLLEVEEKRKEKDITDIEMAEGYSSLVNTMGKKFTCSKDKQVKQSKAKHRLKKESFY